ncbi:MAG: YbaB/EbfC family nucleoid-associated protein [Campylobacter sp.]|uniref:YbaB/EbfC family nucleoid-associated protein n=1 Tax=Campylobacter sp. TaxID=205 RepID=UPI002975A5CD|nr:YbaB/EbfC family nucleoid-associated protein [Campylobacter sp.]MDD7600597.1 YbaB/EbfC family nucleoid-associated protein [Campylobacteraceae bacterium]MDY3663625.1 YbaB/EbfC family nucleoid-associated protein [Campylobacter sp.]MDY5887842.1 YbaB/EbfC family nucleoid-associated protein [Campylobacter sp.]
MFKNMDLSKMSEMISSVKEKVEAYESEVANKIYEAKAGGGMISVKINGNSEIQDIDIDDELLSDKQSLQILLISAINDAITLANEEKKKGAAQAFGLGGLGGFGL